MTPRSIRRAAERQAEKDARKTERLSLHQPLETSGHTVSDAQLAANRANAEKSTGPRTEAGKARTRHNAVRHALTGRTILLPSDDAVLYEDHCRRLQAEFRPVGVREELLVQAITDHHWRLARIPSLEAGLYAVGRDELADTCDDAVLDIHILMAYEKHFRNLQTQQARLTRYLQKDMAELTALQQTRLAEEKEQFETAALLLSQAKTTGQSFHPEEFGFVFSTSDLQAFIEAKGDLRLARHLTKFKSGNVLVQAA